MRISQEGGNDQFRLREAFVQAGNVLESQPDAKFWAGERYYRRQHIEINDFYPLDMSGYGAGVEDLNLGFGKMALAYLAGARPDIVTENGNLREEQHRRAPVRREGPGGTLGGWFDFANSKGGTTPTGTAIPTTDGYAFGRAPAATRMARWLSLVFAPVRNRSSQQLQHFDRTIQRRLSVARARLLVTEQVLFQPNDRFAIMPIFVYQRTQGR